MFLPEEISSWNWILIDVEMLVAREQMNIGVFDIGWTS
jgi:hypothetical protein